jgi:uridine kinase
VGVSGGSGSGKSTFIGKMLELLGSENATVIQHDAYYYDLSHLSLEEREQQNFDHPGALETDLLTTHLGELLEGHSVDIPVYDFSTHTRKGSTRSVSPKGVVFVEGILLLTDPVLRSLLDLTIYLEVAEEVRLSRRMRRDVAERGRTPNSVLNQYLTTVKSMHEQYVHPSRDYADLVIKFELIDQDLLQRIAGQIRGLRSD